MSRIGITTTVPVEVIWAAGHEPCDLNNIFISSEKPQELINESELRGLPRNICAWIKGIYSVAKKAKVRKVIAVTQGDCSDTCAVLERMSLDGIEVIPFAFPFDRDERILRIEIGKLIKRLKTTEDKVREVKKYLDAIRENIYEIDRLTWQENKVTGWENHLWQVSSSDMNRDPEKFRAASKLFIKKAKKRKPKKEKIRIAYIGVPPILDDIYQFIEQLEGRVVFNEVQRQFTMPFKTNDIVEQYLKYTYPYDVFAKIKDIKREIRLRKIKGIIHYVQNFCSKKIEDDIYRAELKIPFLTLECDLPGSLSARDKTRIEVFMEMLKQ